MFGDEIERLMTLHPLTGEVITEDEELYVFPATHYVAGPERMEKAITGIELELADRLAELERQGKLLEAQRLRMRTTYDIEMMRQVGFCSGIENYSRHIDGRAPGSAPHCLIDYFPEDFLLVIDESHVTVPQIGGMYEGDMSRKRTLVDHGFRLPSAVDNRPLKWEEFLERIGQTVYLSATPGPYELGRATGAPVEQIIRPTGLVDPEVVVKPTKGQIDDLVHEINSAGRAQRAGAGHHADQEDGRGPHRLPARARHPGALPALRGRHAAPGRAAARAAAWATSTCWSASTCCARASTCPRCRWCRSWTPTRRASCAPGTSLIQTIGRAARNVSGQVHMYADSDHRLDGQGDRRDQPAPGQAGRLQRGARRRPDAAAEEDQPTSPSCSPARTPTPRSCIGGGGRQQSRGKAPVPGLSSRGAGRHAARRWPACRRPTWPT